MCDRSIQGIDIEYFVYMSTPCSTVCDIYDTRLCFVHFIQKSKQVISPLETLSLAHKED